MKKTSILLPVLLAGVLQSSAQGTLSGDLMMNVNFFQRDSVIKAAGLKQYDNYLSGGEAWLSLRYNYKGFTATLRMDAFQNSILYNPNLTPMTSFGIGAWSLSKDIGDLSITGGYIYDQIGSGILFRSYEDRGLLIDNALVGARLKYKLTDNIYVKGMAGQQKDVSAVNKFYGPIIKSLNVEGDFTVGKDVHLSPGLGALNRTMDQNSWDKVNGTVDAQPDSTRFSPTYNTYAFTAYNTLSVGDFTWYAEGAYKTHEAIIGLNSSLIDKAGNIEFTTLGFARKGFAINLTGKRTENFVMRTSPNETQIRGIMNWQPIVARLHPQRLLARYTPASQDISEKATNADVLIAPNDKVSITTDFTYINTLNDEKLYREAYGELDYRGSGKWLFNIGVQYMEYNQKVYQVIAAASIVKAITPFGEVTYRINNKQSLRLEAEYMSTQQDAGSWAFALLEYNFAPKFSISVSDMYTTDLKKENSGYTNILEPTHFYNAFIAYTKGPHRFSLSYGKQPAGINCSGGVCRYEPAFSGAKFAVTTSF
ncbi:DUF6029 family protein [Chitinophagaceae bacterium MMS25-I14]